MKVGRNQPCPCGSGKKYKQCCLRKDQDARAARVMREEEQRPLAGPPPVPVSPRELPKPLADLPPPAPPPQRERDPHIEACNARWEEFEAQDYEGRIALFQKTLDEKELMDAENAFAMLDRIYLQTVEHNQRDRFDQLAGALRERLPDVFAEHAGFFLALLIENALAAGRREALAPLGNEYALRADQEIDSFNRLVDQLAYHGQLAVLAGMMRLAWPHVKEAGDRIFDWGKHEFAVRGADYEIFAYLEQTAEPDAGDPALLERLRFFLDDLRPEYLPEHLDRLQGKSSRVWKLSDFELKRRPKRSRDEWDEDEDSEEDTPPPDEGNLNLSHLSTEFLGYLRRVEGVPYTKGRLAQEDLVHYFQQRAAGGLEPQGSLFDRVARKRKPRPRPSQPHHLLCPDRATFDRYLGNLLSPLNGLHHRAAATFELVPVWLRFLESRQLLEGSERQRTMQELSPLTLDLHKLWERYRTDPALARGLTSWRREPEKEATKEPSPAAPEAEARSASPP